MGLIYPGMQARLIDGTIMPVRGIVLDPASHTLVSIILGANGFFGPDLMAPAEALWLLDEHVHLALTRDEVCRLPIFHYSGPSHAHAHAAAEVPHLPVGPTSAGHGPGLSSGAH